MKAGDAEWQLGNAERAADYFLRGFIFVHKREPGLKMLAKWKAGRGRGAVPVPKPDPGRLEKIARLYASMKLYPRALQVVRDHAKLLGPRAAELEQEFVKNWLVIRKEHVGNNFTRCVLFGQDVTTEKDWLNVTIPPASYERTRGEAAKTMMDTWPQLRKWLVERLKEKN